jgi:Fe-Mn family superoxide dismutase
VQASIFWDEGYVEEHVNTTRRETIAALAAAGAAAFIPGGLVTGAVPRVAVGKHVPVPLPFDPKKLAGLSERLLVSHHENNYGGAVRNLNKVEEELAGITKDTPGFVVAGLKERELAFTNSVILHELYFGNLGGGGKPAGAVQGAIGSAFGSFGRWEEIFRATAMSLAGGSGWALLDLGFQTGDLRVYWSGNHTQSLAFGSPLLVLDMYEHSYHLDYGAQAARYVDAFVANIRWDEVDRRYARALQASSSLRG